MSDDIPMSNRDARSHEIQSSIAQGKLMLNVLRSLPASENIQAFIVRFEELVSRLQKCESQCNQGMDAKDIVGAQFDLLRKRQETIKSLLEQTTQELQSTFAESLDIPGTSQTTNVNAASSATEALSAVQMKLVNEFEIAKDPLHQVASSDETTVLVSPGQRLDCLDTNSQSKDLKEALPPTNSSIVASTPYDTSANWSTRFAIPVAKLDDLIEDSRKFQNMVEQLITITRRAHLSEATEFLVDISARFVDLRKSFDSLKKSYEEVRDATELPKELRELQLTGFQEFLERLDQNLESTKECFYNIYRIVKSEIESSIADGSLQVVVSDDEETDGVTPVDNSVEQRDDAAVELSKLQKTAAVPALPSGRSDDKAEDPLASQKAYLVALQNQTASERREIQRLLRQRDQLAERLAALKATSRLADSLAQTETANVDAAAATTNVVVGNSNTNDDDDNNNRCPSLSAGVEPLQSSRPAPPTEGDVSGTSQPTSSNCLESLLQAREEQSTLLSHLEQKRRELDRLHAQLTALRQAEFKANSSSRAVQGGGDEEEAASRRNQTTSASDRKRSTGGLAASSPRVTRFQNEVVERSASPSTVAPSGPSNTERLYENMREARMLLEQQRDHRLSCPSTDDTKAVLLLQRLADVASVANSQDRTTLATWGGSSSPVHSSASTVSGDEGDGDEDDVDEVSAAHVISRSPEQLQLTAVSTSPSSLLGFSPSEVVGGGVGGSPVDNNTGRRAAVRQHQTNLCTASSGNTSGDGSSGNTTTAATASGSGGAPHRHLVVTLPQLGRSPSPPTQPMRPAQSPGTGEQMTEPRSGMDSCDAPAAVGPPGMPISELSYALINERMQGMEMSIAQLFQVCRCLALENSMLRSTLGQLLPSPSTAYNELLLAGNPSASSNSGMATPSGYAPADPGVFSSPLCHQLPSQCHLMRQCPVGGAGTPLRSCFPAASSSLFTRVGVGGLAAGRSVVDPLVAGAPQMLMLQHQQQQQQQQQILEAQQIQQLSRLMLQQLHSQQQMQQQQMQQVPLLARRPLLQASSNQVNSCDLHWLTNSMCPPLTTNSANTLTVSAERLPSRVTANGIAGTATTANHLGPSSTSLGGFEVGYNNCLLSPQSSSLPGHQAIVDPLYQVPMSCSSSALLAKYTGGVV